MKNAMAWMAATILCLASFTGHSTGAEETYSMVDPYQEFAGVDEQGAGHGWIPQARKWEPEASSARAADTEYQKRLRRCYDGDLKHPVYQLITFDSQSTPTYKATSSATEVDFTPELIKKQGDENKNYVVMVSASWCRWCKKMYPVVQELRKQGYIIYVFEVDRPEFEDYAALYNVRQFPTFIVYDHGKEVTRTVGKTDQSWFTDRLKTKDEQVIPEPEPEPTPDDPYDGF